MPLASGTKLGQYEIVEAIGAGGMGEVYRARDTKLGREVAIKVLPEELAQDGDRLARFEREAKLLASLNHPAIATLLGFEDDFLVMELVEGETLAERIARGPIPLDEALPLFIQMAEGLEAAHEKGVIHRDLKPANVKITLDGQIKILDFGLARLAEADSDSFGEGGSQSPTLTKGTALGAIMGTASYMSPEQARGKAVDMRTDVWAFGCCLYEALTGKKPFAGDNVTDVLAAVVRAEPDWDVLAGNAPPTLGRLLAQCLEKDRKQRFQHIGDVRIALGGGAFTPGVEPVATITHGSTAVVLGIALVSALVAALVVWVVGTSPDTESRVMRSTINLPPGQELAHFGTMAVSPDGTLLAYTAMESASTHLYLRRFDEFESRRIPGTEGAKEMVFFSPDGNWVGYSTWTALKKVPVGGGASVTLVNAMDAAGATWTEDGWIVYNAGYLRGLARVPSEGGPSEKLTTLDDAYGDTEHVHPQSLPGDRQLVLFFAWGPMAPALLTVDTGEVVRLDVSGTRGALYVPTGHLVYGVQSASSYGVASSWNLVAARFDLERQQIEGAPQTVIRGVYGAEEPLFTISSDGTLAYVPFSGGETKLVWVDRRGRETSVRSDMPMATPRLSPDGRSIVGESGKRLWSLDEERGVSVPLTDAPPAASFVSPAWSPDGASVTGQFKRPGRPWELHEIPVDGSAAPRLLMESGANDVALPSSWSPDGNALVFVRAYDLWIFRRDGEPEPFLETPALERSPRFSPNGRFIAYASDVSGREEVYIRPYSESGRDVLVSTGGGKEPVWSRNGRELFYRRDRQMLAVPVETTDALRVGEPEVLFEGRYLYSAFGWSFPNYDVSLDGEKFLMVKEDEALARDKIRIVQNWFDELERLTSTEN